MFKQIFDGQSSNGTSLTAEHCGGEVEIAVAGNFGGGTVTAMANFIGGPQAVPLDNGTWTEPSVKLLRTVRPCAVYLVLAGATSPDLDAWI